MKHANVNPCTHNKYSTELNDKSLKFKVRVRIAK